MLRVAIVGLGPWGLCALERVVTTARQGPRAALAFDVHVIEPGTPGSGVFDVTQPDYLLLNNPCGQLSLYPFAAESDQPRYGLGLYDWAVARGYRWVGERCAIDPTGRPIDPHDFLPRRLMGEYLQWFYRALVSDAPSGVNIVHHRSSAVDLVAGRDGTEEVHLADGLVVVADHVIVTSGHTANQDSEIGLQLHEVNPYPVAAYAETIPAGARVAVAGMGLVAVDVVTALTVGRGGRFFEMGARLRYAPSGREPVIQLFSRSGLPFTAKSVTGKDRSDVYKPVICTPEVLDALSGRSNGRRRLVDVRTELLPLLFAEMHARYYAQIAFQRHGRRAAGAAVRAGLRAAWAAGRFEDELARLAAGYGSFDPEAVFFGHQPRYHSSGDYEQYVYDALAADLREAEVPDGASPLKSATEVFRIFRDPMRSVVEQGGLSLDSYLDFNADICSRIHRLVAGPPALRSRQLLALMDADVVVRGHLEEPRIEGSASALLAQLYARGRVSQFRYGAVTVGSVDLTPDSHPIDIDGRPQERISMFGS